MSKERKEEEKYVEGEKRGRKMGQKITEKMERIKKWRKEQYHQKVFLIPKDERGYEKMEKRRWGWRREDGDGEEKDYEKKKY